MLRKILYILFFIFIFSIPLSLPVHVYFPKFLNHIQLKKKFPEKSWITLRGKNVTLLPDSQTEIPFENFIDFSSRGYYIKYDKMGALLELFFEKRKIFEWANAYQYPRLQYPYLFLFSSDLTKVRIFDISRTLSKPVLTLNTPDMITAWAAEPEKGYLILGDLSGKYYLYEPETGKLETRRAEHGRIPYIKGAGINSRGDFFILSSLYPEILIQGNILQKDTQNYEVPVSSRSRKKIQAFSRYAFIEKEKGVFIFDQQNEKVIQHDSLSPFYGGIEGKIRGNDFFILGFKEKEFIRLDFFLDNLYHYSIYLSTESLPVFHSENGTHLILWKEGALEI